jgi:acyl carrier protein
MTAADEPFLAKLGELARVPPAALNDDVAIQPADWDSVDLLDLIAAIDDAYGVTVEIKEITACRTVGELRALVAAARAQTDA